MYAPEQLPVLARHPASEALHRIGGALDLLLGVMQFTPSIRARRPRLHRWSGRAFVALSIVAAVSGAYMALAFGYEPGERAPSVLFAAVMIVSALMAVYEIRRGRVEAHRAWVTRCFAVGLGIATIRVMAVIALHTTPWTTRQLITPIFWIGWTVTLAIAELLVRSRRRDGEEGRSTEGPAPLDPAVACEVELASAVFEEHRGGDGLRARVEHF